VPVKHSEFAAQPFADHMRQMRSRGAGWEQGDHVLIAAPTKAGKTTLAAKLLPARSHAVIFVTKLKDPTFELEFKDWTRLEAWPKGGPKPYQNKILLWPKPEKTMDGTKLKQRDVMGTALDAIATEGNRCVCIDECLYMADPTYLGLGKEIGMLHYFGRSSGISMLTLAQRPAWIPKIIYGSVTHAYVARTRDVQDAKRLADFGGIDAKELAANAALLQTRHDYVYINPQGDSVPRVINSRR